MNKKIVSVADYLVDKLPDSPHHKKRNPYAHVYFMIKKNFGCSWKYVKDKEALYQYVDWLKANPC